jgi:hypothetical protein
MSGHLHAPAFLPPGTEPPAPIGGYVGSTASLNAVAKWKIIFLSGTNSGYELRY